MQKSFPINPLNAVLLPRHSYVYMKTGTVDIGPTVVIISIAAVARTYTRQVPERGVDWT